MKVASRWRERGGERPSVQRVEWPWRKVMNHLGPIINQRSGHLSNIFSDNNEIAAASGMLPQHPKGTQFHIGLSRIFTTMSASESDALIV